MVAAVSSRAGIWGPAAANSDEPEMYQSNKRFLWLSRNATGTSFPGDVLDGRNAVLMLYSTSVRSQSSFDVLPVYPMMYVDVL